jgi:hypothetical protein
VLVPFFWGGFYEPFFFSKLFFNLRGISVGALSESKILKMSGHVRKPLKLGALYREAGLGCTRGTVSMAAPRGEILGLGGSGVLPGGSSWGRHSCAARLRGPSAASNLKHHARFNFFCGTGGGRLAPQARKIQTRMGITYVVHRIT